uniref:Uncharacterized protein n=1 Tax=Aegilops tauschii subsp. strangulata TaxID=200361 RepID=A0A453K151_AEGTS
PPPRRLPSSAALSGPTSPPRYSSRRPTAPRCSSRPSTLLCFPSPPCTAMPPQVVHSRYPSPFTTANQCRSMRGRSTKAMVEVKTRCTSSSFVCFSVHLLPDARGRLAATTSHLFLSQRQQEKKGRFTSRCRPHHSHKETPASLPATRTSLTRRFLH